jgi:hypothetical protein
MSRKKQTTFEDTNAAASFLPWCLAQLCLVASNLLFQYFPLNNIPSALGAGQRNGMSFYPYHCTRYLMPSNYIHKYTIRIFDIYTNSI